MRTFKNEDGQNWIAEAAPEATVRHHGAWYLVFRRASAAGHTLEVPEVRWQTAATAERTLRTMGEFELRRRLHSAIARHTRTVGPTPVEGAGHVERERTNASAG